MAAARAHDVVPSKRRRRSRTLPACSACSTAHTTNPSSWGSKRARTAVSHSTSPLHGRPPITKWYVRRRDWANLSDGPAGLIAERVLANDVADYIRFRAVCSSWRLCCTGPRGHGGLDRRFHPRHWIMLREKLAGSPHRRRFLNISTGKCIQTDLPEELRDHDVLGRTTEGLLVLLHRRTSVRLLNPLTCHLIELPTLTTLLPQQRSDRLLSDDNTRFDEDFEAWGSGFTHDSTTFVLCFQSLRVLGVAKPGDARWTLVQYQNSVHTTPLMFAGRFYCINRDDIMVLQTSSAAADQQQEKPPRLEVVAELRIRLSGMVIDTAHLVDNGGELMLVHRTLWKRRNVYKRHYGVYKVDLDNGKLSPVKSLGGRSLFFGMFCSLSVSAAGVFPSINGDTIYLSFDVRERESMMSK